ncbi:MAG: nitrogenase component 1 [Chloroflexota bacterium]|nr:nitrogenase component 1 [Chloroflexota bacterium]
MMKIIESPVEYQERHELGALPGVTESVAGIKGSFVVMHGVVGCTMAANHLKSAGPVVAGNVLPVFETGVGPSEAIMGRNEEMVKRWVRWGMKKMKGKGKLGWIVTSDAPSIIEDDIVTVAREMEKEFNIPFIAMDTSGFLGGFNRGAEMSWCAVLNRFGTDSADKEGINILGPQLMGSKNWPNDINEIVRLLRAADVKINHLVFQDLGVEQLGELTRAKTNYILSCEDFSDFEEKAEDLGMEVWGQDLVLPVGLHNTEEWYLTIAERFGDVEKAKAQMKKDMSEVKKIVQFNYNSTWAQLSLFGKHVGVYGYSPFAVALARSLFYDYNMRPTVIGLLSETSEGLKKAEKLLEPMADYLDFEVMENPALHQYGQKIKEARVDFSIGMRQDRAHTESLNIPHLNMTGPYYFNQFNFVPWPYMGVRGSLYLLSDLWEVVNRSVLSQPDVWRMHAYHSRDEACACAQA